MLAAIRARVGPLPPPQHNAAFERVIRVSFGYGRHLADTVSRRFGTAKFPLILLPSASRQLWSAGLGARVNAAGFVFEFNGARTLSPATGWHFVVNFRPGF